MENNQSITKQSTEWCSAETLYFQGESMPLMHFAFGSLHREGKIKEQLEQFVEKILLPKTLRSFICPEFVPIINSPNAKWGDPDSAFQTEDGGVSFSKWVKSPPVGLLPCDVPMISFVDIPYKKMKTWEPSEHYGKLGLSFKNGFKISNNVKKVSYYALPALEKDPLVVKLNKAINESDENTKNDLWKQVLHYRKPSILWEEFNGLFAPLRISNDPSGVDIKKITYSRYDVGYKFESEQESRIVTENEGDLIRFSTDDILSVIVPDESSKNYLRNLPDIDWLKSVDIKVYPR
jgi:hypothetical protein